MALKLSVIQTYGKIAHFWDFYKISSRDHKNLKLGVVITWVISFAHCHSNKP